MGVWRKKRENEKREPPYLSSVMHDWEEGSGGEQFNPPARDDGEITGMGPGSSAAWPSETGLTSSQSARSLSENCRPTSGHLS